MKKKPGSTPNAPTSREKLRSYVERVTRLEEEKRGLSEDIKDTYSEAKGEGFDPKALRKIVKEVLQTQTQRAAERETEAIVDIYRANLGMLDGTPLGDAARRKYEDEIRAAEDEGRRAQREAESTKDGDAEDAKRSEATPEPTEPSEDDAREQGRIDHAAGKRIVDNPFLAGTRNRAAWDTGFCEADGSDGMEIPRAWRRGGGRSREEGKSA